MSDRQHYEIAVVGGGLSGMMMAIALSYAAPGDADDPAIVLIDRDGSQRRPKRDIRTTTIHAAGKTMLETLGVWAHLEAEPTPITSIKIADGVLPKQGLARRRQNAFRMDWQVAETPMAFVVSNDDLLAALQNVLARRHVHHVTDAEVTGLTRPGDGAGGSLAWLQFANRDDLACHLVVACDGAHSQIRQAASLPRRAATHRQTAIVANLTVERDHANTAFQRFLPTGPLALMPHGTRQVSLVWTLPRNEAEALQDIDDDAFSAAVRDGFGDHLGDMRLDGPRLSWPLVPAVMPRLTAPNLVLAGDAGHVIHPLAGQGYNLALGDAAVLADSIAAAAARGLAPGHRSVLADYETGRRLEVRAMSAMTSGLNEVMSFHPRLARLAGTGMQLINASPVKDLLQTAARGGRLTTANLLQGRLPE